MSDASLPHCKKCHQPEYACQCGSFDSLPWPDNVLVHTKRLAVDLKGQRKRQDFRMVGWKHREKTRP